MGTHLPLSPLTATCTVGTRRQFAASVGTRGARPRTELCDALGKGYARLAYRALDERVVHGKGSVVNEVKVRARTTYPKPRVTR